MPNLERNNHTDPQTITLDEEARAHALYPKPDFWFLVTLRGSSFTIAAIRLIIGLGKQAMRLDAVTLINSVAETRKAEILAEQTAAKIVCTDNINRSPSARAENSSDDASQFTTQFPS
ncbi:hypothetical protein KBC79_04490 [Candidatus Woesebacteria bacterium]|nr:hypothetical protein [Candidatus Woesebacteria bacterium]